MEQTRVNIQYSIDLEDLPSEIERMIHKATESVCDAVKEGDSLHKQEDLLTIATLSKIDELRINLSRADMVLEDVVKIVNGYLKMNMDAASQAQQPYPAQPEPSASNPNNLEAAPRANAPSFDTPFKPATPDLHELQERLQQFADSVADENSSEIAVD